MLKRISCVLKDIFSTDSHAHNLNIFSSQCEFVKLLRKDNYKQISHFMNDHLSDVFNVSPG